MAAMASSVDRRSRRASRRDGWTDGRTDGRTSDVKSRPRVILYSRVNTSFPAKSLPRVIIPNRVMTFTRQIFATCKSLPPTFRVCPPPRLHSPPHEFFSSQHPTPPTQSRGPTQQQHHQQMNILLSRVSSRHRLIDHRSEGVILEQEVWV